MNLVFQRSLEEINRYHRMGFDQTENFTQFFNYNSKAVELAKIDAVKQSVQDGAFYLSRKKSKKVDEYLIVDMFKGHVYKINSEHYTVEIIDDNILAIDNVTDEENFLIVDGSLNFGDVRYLGIENYTYCSSDKEKDFKGVPAVRFNNSYKDSIRVHWLIAMMKWGIEEISKCVGKSPTQRLRHKIAYIKSKDNSVENLEILPGKDEEKFWDK